MRSGLICFLVLLMIVVPTTIVRAQAEPTPIRLDAPAAQNEPPAQDEGVIELQGRGQQITPVVALNAGLAVAELSHDGQRNFAAILLDASGAQVELLSNTIGPTRMSTAFGLRAGGDYSINVQADGAWTVRLRQPSPVVESASTSYSGTGATATPLFALSSGLRRFTLTHGGTRNFAVQLLDADGRLVDLLANTIGPFDGSKGVQIRRDGVFILTIQADGPWTVSFE